MSRDEPRVGWASRGRLSGVVCSLPVDGALIEEYLADLGPLRIDPPDGAEPSILCEFMTIRSGRALLAGLDVGEEIIRWAGSGAGLPGLLWGAGLGWLSRCAGGGDSDARYTIVTEALAGLERTSARVGRQMRQLIRAISLPTYRELVLAVPDVCIGKSDERHVAVLDAVTDSPLALGIDRFFYFGYGKRLGSIGTREPGRWSVCVDGGARIEADLSNGSARSEDVQRVNGWWSQPLLSGIQNGKWARSSIERRIDDGDTAWGSLSGTVVGLDELETFDLDYEIAVGSKRREGTAVAYQDVNTRISWPHPARGRRCRG